MADVDEVRYLEVVDEVIEMGGSRIIFFKILSYFSPLGTHGMFEGGQLYHARLRWVGRLGVEHSC